MARKLLSDETKIIEKAQAAMFPFDWLRDTANKTGLTEIEPKIDPAVIFWSLILGFGVDLQKSLADLKRYYGEFSDERFCNIAWYCRFTPELTSFLKACVIHAIEYMAQEQNQVIDKKRSNFHGLLIQNSVNVRLNESMSESWPPSSRRKAATGVKLSCLVSADSENPKDVCLLKEQTNDLETMQIGPWIKNHIFLTDIGSINRKLIDSINENGGYFISRLRNRDDPIITEAIRPVQGDIVVEGQRLGEVLTKIEKQVLDLNVEVPLKGKGHSGGKKRDGIKLRVVAALNKVDWNYFIYSTNIPSEALRPEEIAQIYSARLDLDFVFEELTRKYALDLVETTRQQIIEAYIWMAVLTLLVNRRLYAIVSEGSEGILVPFTRPKWFRIFQENASFLQTSILEYGGISEDVSTIVSQALSIYDSFALDPQECKTGLREEWWT
jgi:putative transposase